MPATPNQRKTVFQPEFLEDLKFWVENDQRVTLKVLDLVKETCRDPFKGKGKPEPLKYLDPNAWSRRLTQEHRIVYLVKDDEINFLQARYHY
ncbi:Txe/YoeB family addiction module toxin [Nostoc sp. CCCryo 231-06]|nr:Txe/YoeB family addiction module toxin [Nostoc sp. CCCryo 231-06]